MSQEKSRLRKEVEEIPKEKRKLHRSLTKISMKVHRALRKQDITYEELEREIERHKEERPGEWIERMLGGGVNLSLRTIFRLEEVLDIELVNVLEHESETSEGPGRRQQDS